MHTLQKSISSVLVGVTMKIMNVYLHSYLLVQIESNSLKYSNVIYCPRKVKTSQEQLCIAPAPLRLNSSLEIAESKQC